MKKLVVELPDSLDKNVSGQVIDDFERVFGPNSTVIVPVSSLRVRMTVVDLVGDGDPIELKELQDDEQDSDAV